MYMMVSVFCQMFICFCYSLALYDLAVVILDWKPEKRCYDKKLSMIGIIVGK